MPPKWVSAAIQVTGSIFLECKVYNMKEMSLQNFGFTPGFLLQGGGQEGALPK